MEGDDDDDDDNDNFDSNKTLTRRHGEESIAFRRS
jgi:hypothetical protein